MSTCEDNVELTLGGTRYIMDRRDAEAVEEFIRQMAVLNDVDEKTARQSVACVLQYDKN